MSEPIHAFDYLAKPSGSSPPAICVVFGNEPLLKRLVLDRLRAVVLGSDAKDVPDVSFDGASLQWRQLADELRTVSLFGEDRRLVVVSDAGDFVSAHRTRLEDYAAAPSDISVLVLNVASWPGNTRLYQLVAKSGLAIDCSPPQTRMGRRKVLDEARLIQWLGDRAKKPHRAKLPRQAARQLLDLVGPNLGLLDQELAKLALFVEPGTSIAPDLVTQVVGGWRTQTTWDLLDAATEGNAADALLQLDRLLQAGEAPLGLFGAISWSLRRFADATRIVQQAERDGKRVNLRNALEQAGFRKWPADALQTAERQLRQIGRERAGELYQWLLRADLALKGTHSPPERARLVIENLIFRLARQARPAARSGVAAR